MKILSFKTNKTVIVLGYNSVSEMNENYLYYQAFDKSKKKIYCIADEINEKTAKGLVITFLGKYIDYKTNKSIESALQSFISKINNEGYYWGENPFKKPNDINKDNIDYELLAKKWRECEKKTFYLDKTIIFVYE